MNLRTYFMGVLENPTQRAEFAKRAGVSKTYIHQLICKTPRVFRTPGKKLALALHEASGGAISLNSMRPDLWPLTSSEDGGIKLDPLPEGRT